MELIKSLIRKTTSRTLICTFVHYVFHRPLSDYEFIYFSTSLYYPSSLKPEQYFSQLHFTPLSIVSPESLTGMKPCKAHRYNDLPLTWAINSLLLARLSPIKFTEGKYELYQQHVTDSYLYKIQSVTTHSRTAPSQGLIQLDASDSHLETQSNREVGLVYPV